MQIKNKENYLNIYIKIFSIIDMIRAERLKVCYRLINGKSNF